MKIILNGKEEIVKEGINISDLFQRLNVDKESCIILLDDEVIAKDKYSKKIYENANIEILRFVSGG